MDARVGFAAGVGERDLDDGGGPHLTAGAVTA